MIDIMGDAEDKMENGVKKLMKKMNVNIEEEIWNKKSELEVDVKKY
jgi:hypothetical protein